MSRRSSINQDDTEDNNQGTGQGPSDEQSGTIDQTTGPEQTNRPTTRSTARNVGTGSVRGTDETTGSGPTIKRIRGNPPRGGGGGGRDMGPGRDMGRLHGLTITSVSSVVPATEIHAVEAMVRSMTEDVLLEFERTRNFADWHDEMRSFAAAIQYVGLDVVNMRRALCYYASQCDPDDYRRPIMIAIISGLKRGNNVDRMRESVQDSVKAHLGRIINTLHIESRTNKKPNTITLARIMVCFPEYAAMVSTVISSPGPVDDIPANYPWCMRNGSFSGLIPRKPRDGKPDDANVIETLKRAHAVYQARTSLVLDRKVKIINKALIARQMTFVSTGITQGTTTDENRWTLLSNSFYGVMLESGLNPAITALSAAMNQYNE